MDSVQLQELMRGKLEGMPTKARRVIEYLLSNMREAAFRSIGEVADDLSVSKAQLVRVARILGFDGYSDLKEALQQAILEKINPATMLARVMDDQESLPNVIYKTEHANLDDTWSQLPPGSLDAFCSLVREARNIHCLGWGISSLVTEHLFMRLRVMGLAALSMRRGSLTLLEQARSVGGGDLIVVCELPSYVVEVTETVELARKKGAKVVAIVDSPAAPLCRFSDLNFFISAASPTFGSSIVGPLFLTHILTSVLAVHMGDRAHTALEEQAQFLHDERIFHPVFGLKY
ncbi:MurR/RpiR family transcriptional regulator [Aminithiophilus ramosus]|uniref:MurR/RpiR family transcriptional regulator n=1 Tax=Aminithiophilus ramosus TaxID=3029084 RepID=A0A9Q7EWM9_9BACT|nr:MurR/RpiR family transcriptional regulator [Aminithiophilus ramosus]QTX31750.1 MurR/RpiR family transcriptional regulator [Aminithiophilus ramosus]